MPSFSAVCSSTPQRAIIFSSGAQSGAGPGIRFVQHGCAQVDFQESLTAERGQWKCRVATRPSPQGSAVTLHCPPAVIERGMVDRYVVHIVRISDNDTNDLNPQHAAVLKPGAHIGRPTRARD